MLAGSIRKDFMVEMPAAYRQHLSNIALITLIATNLLPLFGVLFFGWDAFYLVLFYWSENLAVGFYTILKIALVKVPHPIEHLGKLFVIPFFTIHYGGFVGVHGLFILAMFKRSADPMPHGNTWPCFLVFVQLLIGVIHRAYSLMTPNMRIAMLALFVSHGVSFVQNYLLKKEYAVSKADRIMGEPYPRIFVMHVAILFGGFISAALGSPIGVLVILVMLKTVIDVKMHLREHQKKASIPQNR